MTSDTTSAGSDAAEIDRIREALAEFYTEEGINVWLNSPHRQLAGRKAIDLIEAEGGADRVWAIIEILRGGMGA
jgi:uncharacterized protein (DUF2384 family)